MTRPADGSALKGETQLIEDELADWRDERLGAMIWGRNDEAGRLPRLIVYPLILLFGLALWVIGIWALWGWLS